MSQLTLGLVSGLGIWTVGIGVTAVTGTLNNERTELLSLNSGNIRLISSRDIKEKHIQLPCVNSLFEEVEWKTTSTLTSIKAVENTEVDGCLSIWWEKEIYDEEKWKGFWRFLWGMKNEVSGMIVMTNAEANNGKIVIDTFLYLLEKKDNKWSMASETGFEKSEIKQGNTKDMTIIFPKDELINSVNGWNFDFDSDKICSKTKQCMSETPKQISLNLNWNFLKGKEYRAYEWIKNIDNLILFGNTIKTYLSKINGYLQPE